jgi:hypothetical protein
MKQCMAAHSFDGKKPFAEVVHDLTGARVTGVDGFHYYEWGAGARIWGFKFGGEVTSKIRGGGPVGSPQWVTFGK